MDILDNVWVEKYRPSTTKDIIMPKSFRRAINKFIKDKSIPNILFKSINPGTGKTTLGKALLNDIDFDYKIINNSLKRGLDTLRYEIDKFIQVKSFGTESDMKVVFLDEFDGSTIDLQKALRAFIEEYSETCRFIVSLNNANSIIEPLRNRFKIYNFDFGKNEKEEMFPSIKKRLQGILKVENVEYDDSALEFIINKNFPSIRGMISDLNDSYDKYGIIDMEIAHKKINDNAFIELVLKKDLIGIRKFLKENDIEYNTIYNYLYDNVIFNLPNNKAKAESIPVVSEFMWRQSYGVINEEINLIHCIFNIMKKF